MSCLYELEDYIVSLHVMCWFFLFLFLLRKRVGVIDFGQIQQTFLWKLLLFPEELVSIGRDPDPR